MYTATIINRSTGFSVCLNVDSLEEALARIANPSVGYLANKALFDWGKDRIEVHFPRPK